MHGADDDEAYHAYSIYLYKKDQELERSPEPVRQPTTSPCAPEAGPDQKQKSGFCLALVYRTRPTDTHRQCSLALADQLLPLLELAALPLAGCLDALLDLLLDALLELGLEGRLGLGLNGCLSVLEDGSWQISSDGVVLPIRVCNDTPAAARGAPALSDARHVRPPRCSLPVPPQEEARS